MINSPPSINFKGDRAKAQSLKSEGLEFYNFVASQAKIGGVGLVNRSKTLLDGSIITVTTTFNEGYNLRTGTILIDSSSSKIEEELLPVWTIEAPHSNTTTYPPVQGLVCGFDKDLNKKVSYPTLFNISDMTDSRRSFPTEPVIAVFENKMFVMLRVDNTHFKMMNIKTGKLISLLDVSNGADTSRQGTELIITKDETIHIQVGVEGDYPTSIYSNIIGRTPRFFTGHLPLSLHSTVTGYAVSAYSNRIIIGADTLTDEVGTGITAIDTYNTFLWKRTLPHLTFIDTSTSSLFTVSLEKDGTISIIRILDNNNGSLIGTILYPYKAGESVVIVRAYKENLYLFVRGSDYTQSHLAHYILSFNPFSFKLGSTKRTALPTNSFHSLTIDQTL